MSLTGGLATGESRPARSGAVVFGLVCGFLAGVLVAAVAIPRHLTVAASRRSGTDQTNGGRLGDEGSANALASGNAGSTSSAAVGATSAAARPGGGSSLTGSRGAAGTAAIGPAVRGVTGGSVTIGIAVPDLGALKALGAGYDWGNPQTQMEAVLDDWKRRGLVPVNGRDVHFVYSSYSILDANAQRATCVTLVEDDGSFSVAGFRLLGPGAACVAAEHHTPLLMADSSGIDDPLLLQGAPFLFSLQMSESRMLRNWPMWADAHHLLQGRTLGVYYDSAIDQDVKANLLSTLDRLGYHPAVVASTDQSTGGPQDAVVVRQFQTANVNTALMLVGAITQTDFIRQADGQGYRPAYLENDYLDNIGDTAPSTYPAAAFDGSYGMAGLASGQTTVPVPAKTNACIDNYVRYSGENRPSVGNAEWNSILISCDLGDALITTLQRAGRNLTVNSYVAAMETIQHMAATYVPPVTFGPGKHAGVDDVRTVRWSAGCTCWGVAQDYQPLWLR